jgi:hypothetical protein
MWKVARFILGVFGFRHASGVISVVHSGNRTIKVLTGFTPKKVWLNLKAPCGIPVCYADRDSFDYIIIPDGFVLFVNLANEYREIEWIAEGRGKVHKHPENISPSIENEAKENKSPHKENQVDSIIALLEKSSRKIK